MAETADTTVPPPLAALDLGSNSFHLLIARVANGRIQVIDRLKEMVRLAGGIDTSGNLTEPAIERALASLSRMGQRLRPLEAEVVRVVGTNTLRRARNARAFVTRAQAVLGHRIEIISGREEARLIYAGVCHALAPTGERRLVVDIGGGSTELILGEDHTPKLRESLYMGCVSFSEQFFSDGRIRPRRFEQALLAARQELEPLETKFRAHGWATAIGASGTLIAIREVAAAMGLAAGGITAEIVDRLRHALVDAGDVSMLSLPGLSAERAPVFPGGLAILAAIMAAFRIETMQVSDGALREGLLIDLVGRTHDQDQRDVSIDDLARRYHVDREHAARVGETALSLLANVAKPWGLSDAESQKLLGWAAAVHEIGTDIAHNQYHKHGHYLLLNMDLAGFSRDDQRRLALLVRAHRRRFPVPEFAAVGTEERTRLTRLAVLLRIAVVLHRSRTAEGAPEIEISARGSDLRLRFPRQWLDSRPLTVLELEEERSRLTSASVSLLIDDLPPARVAAD